MIKILANWILNAIAIYLVSYFISGIRVENFKAALLAVFVIGLLNTFIKPVLVFLTLPITFLTLGLFIFLINAILLLIAASITPGFYVDGLGAALLGSLLFTIITIIFNKLVE